MDSKVAKEKLKFRVAFLSPSFYPATKYGGPIFSTLNTCRELLRAGVRLDIHTTNVDRGGRLDVEVNQPCSLDELDGHNVTYHKEDITDRFSLSFLFNVPKAIKKCDIVHSQSIFSFCTPLAILCAIIYGKKVVVSPRGSLGEWCLNQGSLFKKTWIFIFFRPFLNRIYWHVTAGNEKNDVISLFPNVKKEQFIIIPNGINLKSRDFFSKEYIFKIVGVEAPCKYVISSGRVDDKKGFDYTIKAISNLQDVHLVIMGEDYGSKDHLTKLAMKLNVADRVHFIGHISNDLKWSFYKHADVFSLNSRHENFGNVYLESLSVGTPIISSVFTPWSFINDMKGGVCIENDPLLISESITEMIENKNQLSADCKAIARGFSWEKIAEQFIIEYRRVINVS